MHCTDNADKYSEGNNDEEGSGGRGCADETDLLSSLLAAVPHHESHRKALPSTKMH